jgi:hypothetical protein
MASRILSSAKRSKAAKTLGLDIMKTYYFYLI